MWLSTSLRNEGNDARLSRPVILGPDYLLSGAGSTCPEPQDNLLLLVGRTPHFSVSQAARVISHNLEKAFTVQTYSFRRRNYHTICFGSVVPILYVVCTWILARGTIGTRIPPLLSGLMQLSSFNHSFPENERYLPSAGSMAWLRWWFMIVTIWLSEGWW